MVFLRYTTYWGPASKKAALAPTFFACAAALFCYFACVATTLRNKKSVNAMHNNYALQHVTLRSPSYKQLQAAIAALHTQARKRKQVCVQRFMHTNKNNYAAKFTLANKRIALLV